MILADSEEFLAGIAVFAHPFKGTKFIAAPLIVFSEEHHISWFIYRTRNKYKLGEVFKINFNDVEQKLEIKTVNLANNKVKDNYYDYKNLSFDIRNTEDFLFGKQRILTIKNYNTTVHEINFDRTAWCRDERIENLIEKLKTGHNN